MASGSRAEHQACLQVARPFAHAGSSPAHQRALFAVELGCFDLSTVRKMVSPGMKYISCFSGIGGLEASKPPILFCESSASAAGVLRSIYPTREVWSDVRTLDPPQADVVAGGWPCQDLSVAGQQAGMAGAQSGLLGELIRVAARARARVIVAENVPNLLRLRNGREFAAALDAWTTSGFGFIGWRIVNAREIGLPQNRRRLILVASREPDLVGALFQPLAGAHPPPRPQNRELQAAGFYWTGGLHSINYGVGYAPAIKVGSSLGIPSPPAVHYGDVVRKVTPREALDLQGFGDLAESAFESTADAYRAAGNAVPRPMGRWIMDSVLAGRSYRLPDALPVQPCLHMSLASALRFPEAGTCIRGQVTPVRVTSGSLANNLGEFLDATEQSRLSQRAARGLIERLDRSGHPCPDALRQVLSELALAGA